MNYTDPSGYFSLQELMESILSESALDSISMIKYNIIGLNMKLELTLAGRLVLEISQESVEMMLEGSISLEGVMLSCVEVAYGMAGSEEDLSGKRKRGTKGAGNADALLKGIDRGNPGTYYSYTDLKKLIKGSGLSGSGKGLEAHHLLEKQFADVFGINKNDIISVPLTPQWHRNVNSAMGNNIDNLINSELSSILTNTGKSSAGVQEIWAAHRNVYEKIGQSDWSNAIYEAYVKKYNVPYK